MGEERKSYLCVGGPLAGLRYEAAPGSGFAVPVITDRTFVNSYNEVQPEFERHEYRRETFHTPQGDVSMWIPAGQTPLQTITMLLETYERAEISEWSGRTTEPAEARATPVEKVIAAVRESVTRKPLGATNAERIVESLQRAGYRVEATGD